MSFVIKPAGEAEITHLNCPLCREKVPRVGIKKGSTVIGLTWKCRRCGNLWEVEATEGKSEKMK